MANGPIAVTHVRGDVVVGTEPRPRGRGVGRCASLAIVATVSMVLFCLCVAPRSGLVLFFCRSMFVFVVPMPYYVASC